MKNRKSVIAIYFLLFMACIWCSSNIQNDSQYERTMRKFEYQLGYKDTYSKEFAYYSDDVSETALEESEIPKEKTIYLTFDDGPSPRTEEILDILKKHNIKATFFVVKCKDEYIPYMKRAVEEGHMIGVHTASHKYNEIYKSVDAYLRDFTECYDFVLENTGKAPTIFRFPGGSVNNYNASTRKEIVREMTRRGFTYFDWNVESGDSASKASAQTIYNNVINGCKGKQRGVIIMHDSIGKNTTVEALEDIIVKFEEDGWKFASLDNTVKPMIFRMK